MHKHSIPLPLDFNTLLEVDNKQFNHKAIELFHFQFEYNEVYRKYCDLLACKKEAIQQIEDIPFLPISFFKDHKVTSSSFDAETIFESSGTTTSIPSRHYIKELGIYEKSFLTAFESFYGAIDSYCILGLLPSYLERKGSSLVYMVNELIQRSKHAHSGFFLNDMDKLKDVLHDLSEQQQRVLLIGVSFGLLDFVENYQVPSNEQLIVMETGGMKGRRKELIRGELHAVLKKGFQIEQIHSEYGMTELLSQAYAKADGLFTTPPWMKVLIRKQDDPFSYCANNETGGINVIDLANIHSCAFIQTDDLGKMHTNGSFEVLGRFDASEVRGCNLMLS